MVDFDKFDDQIDVAEVNKKVKEAKDSGSFDDVPKGLYTCSVEKMESPGEAEQWSSKGQKCGLLQQSSRSGSRRSASVRWR